jgi:hypothetical protein
VHVTTVLRFEPSGDHGSSLSQSLVLHELCPRKSLLYQSPGSSKKPPRDIHQLRERPHDDPLDESPHWMNTSTTWEPTMTEPTVVHTGQSFWAMGEGKK